MDSNVDYSNTRFSPDGDEIHREAAEVFIHMHRNFRVSRNLRAQWFFDHLSKTVSIQDEPTEDEYGREMTVLGIIPKKGSVDEFVANEVFKVCLDTKVTFLSRYYRQVFILDLSPSTIVADEQSNSCLHHKLLECLQLSLSSVVRSFTIPGTRKKFRPQVYVSIIVFVPFLSFSEKSVLVHGDLLTESNVCHVLEKARVKFDELLKSLHSFSQPILRTWVNLQRHHRMRLDEFPARKNSNQETEDFMAMNAVGKNMNGTARLFQTNSLNERKQDIWYYDDQSLLAGKFSRTNNGYTFPESAILFILRLGLITMQSLPEHTQSNIVVITDGVAGIPDTLALEELLNQIRNQTVSCSFIQVQGASHSEACFGHVSSGELFHFLAMATFGSYLPYCRCSGFGLGSIDESEEEDDTIYKELNSFHRSLLCWSFQNFLEDNVHISNLLKEISTGFAEFQKCDSVVYPVSKGTYQSKLHEMLYVRLREGFSMKKVEYLKHDARIKIHLSMPFRPLVFVEYTIVTVWPTLIHNREAITTEIFIRGPKPELKDFAELNRSEMSSSEERKRFISSLNSTIKNIQEADELMMHIHSFNCDKAYFNLPAGIGSRAIFHIDDPTSIGQRYDTEDDFGKFLNFWKVLCNIDDGVWQKWVHIHFERVILQSKDLPNNVFNKLPVNIDCGPSETALYGLLKDVSSFCLLRDKLYVTFVRGDGNDKPTYFYMIRVSQEPPCLILKTAFPGGVHSCERTNVVEEIRNKLKNLKIGGSSSRSTESALTVFRRPLERILIRYGHAPVNMEEIVRISPEEPDEPNEVAAYNTISKYLYCKRRIWKLFPFKQSYNREEFNATYILNLILTKRRHEGFKTAWTKNGMVSVCRQVFFPCGPALEQFIIFPPTLRIPSQRSNRLLAASPRPWNDDKINSRSLTRPADHIVLTSEAWIEPSAEYEIRGPKEPAPHVDDDIIALLFSIDQLLRICDFPAGINRLNSHDVVDDREDEAETSNSRSVSIVHQSVRFAKLALHSNRVLIHVPTFETDADFKPKRMKTFFNCLTRELDSLFTISVDMEDPAIFSKVYDDVVKHSLEKRPEHFPNTKCRVYMKKLTPWSVLQLFVPQLPENPQRGEWINWDDFPVIASICDEPQLAYGLVTGKPLGSVRELDCGKEEYFPPASWEKEKIYDVPESLILKSRCSNHSRQTYSAIELIEVVRFVYFNVVERALVSAVHACFCRGIAVTPSIVQSVLNEQCKCESYEVESVSSALEAFCGHLNESTKEKNSYCCEESNLSNLFKESLGRNFHEVPGIDNYFFYQAQKGDSGSETRRGSLRVDGSNADEERDKAETVDDDSGSNVGSLRTRSRIEEFTKFVDEQANDGFVDMGSSKRSRRKQDTPVFIVFQCALHFKDGPMDCFPISFIPSCIHNLLKQSRCLPQTYDIKDITVKMLLYVLTWPSQKQFKRDGSSSDSSESGSVEGFVGLACDRSTQFLKNLPNKERTAIRQLLDGMNRLLELESILIDSRKEKITLEKLKKISNFISEETSKSGDHGRIGEEWCPLSLVEYTEEIKETLMERLDGFKINYCRLKRLNNTNYFYICKVENMEEFYQSLPMAEKEVEVRGATDTEASGENEKDGCQKHGNSSYKRIAYRCTSHRISENMRGFRSTDGGDVSLMSLFDRKDLLSDFWIILVIDETVSVKFCQRYKTQHTEVFDCTWASFRNVIRIINQERLLAKMYELRECDPLLLCPEDLVSSKLSESDDSDDDDKLPVESRVFETDRTAFAPGYFACPLQKLYWFNVHSRLKKNGSSFECASELMRSVIKNLAVKNVPNTYVIRETNGNVLYMHLYTSKAQFETDAQNNKFSNYSSKRFIKEVDQMIGSRILLAVYGITQPSEDFNNSIIASIQACFDEEVLNVLIKEFQKTETNVIFDKDDVKFVQRAPQEPSAVFRFPIPLDMRDFLEDLYYYTQQHLQIPMSVARCKESVNFVPYSNNYSAQSQTFFVYVKTPNQESEINKKKGVACLELRFVDSDGQSLLLTPGVLREHSHTLLVKTFNSDKDRLSFYKALTSSTDRQPFTSTLVMQVFVWQRGDVNLEELKLILRRVLERACCDVVTEFGILNLKIIETSSILGSVDLLPQSPHSNPGYRSQLGSSKASPVPSDKRPSLRKRDSSETLPSGTQPTTPSHTLESSRKAGSSVFSFDTTRRGSMASEIGGSMESMVPTQKFLNSKLVSSIVNFFDFVIAKEIENKSSMVSVHSYTWEFDCQNTLRKALSEICDKLKDSLQNEDIDLSDKIYFCERLPNNTGPDRYSVKQDKDWKIVPQFTQDKGTLMNEKSKTDYIILANVEKVAQETLRYGYEITKTALPAVLEKVANDSNTCNMFSPGFNPFVPRQRILYGVARGESLTVYFYNYNPEKIRDLLNFINRATLWHLARSRLSREISLHKLGITHLSPVQKSAENPYLCLVWRSTAKLIELEYPADELNAVAIEGLPELIADLVLRPIRKADFSFVPNYQSQCLIKNQLDQVLSLRSDLERRMHRFITLLQVHARLRKDGCEIKESELAALLECSRRVHFVQTPVLLFPKWRRKIAEIRATIEPKTPKKDNASRPPTGASSSSRRPRSSTLSVSSSAQQQQQQPLRFKSEHEDPFEVKILYMLMNDYIFYLKSIGLKPFQVTNLTEKSKKMHWYQTDYPQGCTYAPTVTLFKETCGGIVVIKLSFLQPYFILSIHVYSSSDLIQPNRNINDLEAKSRWRKLEELKDSILSKCHVHSFTYDFHLRILSKYLVGKDQVLFSNGYNTYSFLVDFLKYYGCRPPNARNCVYEVRPTFELKHGVAAKDIWTHFLDMHYEKHYGWTVVRLKNSEDDASNKAHDFMLVSSEKPRNLNGLQHEKLRVLLRDRRKEGKAGQLHLVQYLVLVDGAHISPMEDEVHREEYNQDDVGEFLHVEGPSEAEKEAEIDMLVGIISEGGLPLVDGSVNRKRRFSSGGIEKTANQIRGSGSNNRLETDLSYSPIRNGPKADSDSDMPSRLSVEGSSSRRHRKTIDSDDVEMPGEKVIYVQFLCAKQRNLQMILEEAVMDYTKLLDDAVLEAEWKCRRDNIWSKILVPKKALFQTSAFKSLLPSKNPQTDVWGILKAYSHDLPSDEFETLLEYVHQINMSDREKRLISLLQGTNCARLCRFLFARYGSDRCRFLEYPPPSTKKCLLITNPNNPNYTLFLISCEAESTPELSVLLKDNYLNDTLDDDTRRYHEKLLDQAFDELVQCVTASLWADLLLRPPGRA